MKASARCPLRPIDDGLVYHVINRGNNRQSVFHDEGDYVAFLNAVADLKEREPFALYGYCLTPFLPWPTHVSAREIRRHEYKRAVEVQADFIH